MRHQSDRARDIPTDSEARELRRLAREVQTLTTDRQEALMSDIDARATIDAAPHALTLAEIAETYRLSVRTLLRYIEQGELEALKIGRGYRVTREQLAAWLERRTVRPSRP